MRCIWPNVNFNDIFYNSVSQVLPIIFCEKLSSNICHHMPVLDQIIHIIYSMFVGIYTRTELGQYWAHLSINIFALSHPIHNVYHCQRPSDCHKLHIWIIDITNSCHSHGQLGRISTSTQFNWSSSHNTRLISTKASQIFQHQSEIPSPVVARCGHESDGLIARVGVLWTEIYSIQISDDPANEWLYELQRRCGIVV